MTTIVKWVAAAFAAALVVSYVVRIAENGLHRDWLGVLFGIVALGMILTINPDHRSANPPSADKAELGE